MAEPIGHRMPKSRDQRASEGELAYHRREWRVQRAGWALMTLIVVAALAGVFGSGPLSDVTAGDPARGTIAYQRFARYGAETMAKICAPSSANHASHLQVGIPRDYLEAFEIRSIVPEASTMKGTAGEVEFVFDVSAQRSCIVFRFEPRRVGAFRGTITVGAGQPVAVRQFVYP